MNKKQKKIIRWILIIFSIILLVLIVILTPIMTEVVWSTKDFNDYQNACIALMVITPLLASGISFLISEKFIAKSLQDAKNKLENIYDLGYIEVDKYVEMLQYLDNLEDKRVNAKIELETKKQLAKIKSENSIKKRIEKAKEDIYEREKEELVA